LELVAKAVGSVKNLQLDGKNLNFRVNAMGDYNPLTSVFIKFLPEGISEQDLFEEFSNHGLILSLMVIIYKENRFKWFNVDPPRLDN